jgi:hypothetical protein
MLKRQGLKRLGLGLVICAGVGGVGWAQGATKFDGQYVGELTLTGIINGDCTRPPPGSAYPLTVLRGEVRFKYIPRFDTVLVGTVDPNGSFKAVQRLRSGAITMTGRIQAGEVTANIVSPSCQYSFQTKN